MNPLLKLWLHLLIMGKARQGSYTQQLLRQMGFDTETENGQSAVILEFLEHLLQWL